jgi:transmembrane sensor
VDTESHNAIDEAAGDWFAKRESGQWSADDQERFDRWLSESPHRVAYLRIERVWERAERLKALRSPVGEVPPPGKWVLSPFFDPPAAPAASTPDVGSGMPSPTEAVGRAVAASPPGVELFPSSDQQRVKSGRLGRRSRVGYLALAASVLVAIAASVAWYIHSPGSTYRTPVGGLESVPMADGSRVTLNTDSAIRVSVTTKERGVELERGEAFFEVAHDPSRPFVVHVGAERVLAVGTAFSVRRDGDDVQVIVTEGTVRLEPGDRRHGLQGDREPTLSNRSSSGPSLSASGARIDSSSAGSAVVVLPAGSIAHADEAGVLVQEESPAQAEDTLSWRAGVLVFHDMTLGDAVAEFNRYNTRQIVIEDPAVARLRIAGNFRATNVEAFVRLLEHGYPLRVEQQEDEVVLKPR